MAHTWNARVCRDQCAVDFFMSSRQPCPSPGMASNVRQAIRFVTILGSSFRQEAFVQAFLTLTDTTVPSMNVLQADPDIPEFDPALWSFLTGETPECSESPCGEDDGSLLDYFQTSTSYGVVLEDGLGEPIIQ